ncbi:MAG: DEAD/DEAH box helicase [Phycisphaerales bacterium]|nr:DEAD/DEAH box helicase [Phycisphaerales bacterium]
MTISTSEFLSPAGPIAKRLANFELRPQQASMAAAVDNAFANHHHLIVEAGTGVGKSFAYLIPAIAQVEQKKKIVISTHTISLQEQLIEKDIPFLQAVSGQEFSAVLCKGRSNYLCMRRLEQASRKSISLFPDLRASEDLTMIEEWANETKDGSLSDLPRQPAWQVWDKLCAEQGNCLGRRCRNFDRCFYQMSRRRMAHGQLLICNHALFFSDLALRQGGGNVLPDYDFVILDEAHTVESVASDHFGLSVSEASVRYLLHSLFTEKTHRGFLATLENMDTLPSIAAIQTADAATNDFFESLDRWRASKGPPNGRVREKFIVENPLTPVLMNLAKSLQALSLQLAAKSKNPTSEDTPTEDDPPEGKKLTAKEYELEKLRLELASYTNRVTATAGAIESLLSQELKDAVYWIESSGKIARRLKWTCSPINVAPHLKAALFDEVPSVILTSATLAIAGAQRSVTGSDPALRGGRAGSAFAYLRSRVGLGSGRGGEELLLGSPFDYQKQCTLYLEASLPSPEERTFLDAAMERALHYIRQTNGHAFILFTSYAMLDRAAAILSPSLAQLGYPMLTQGGGQGKALTRSQLLAQFKATPNSVLLGTDSFWQGVDVRGDALRNVIITKLPFEVPDKPLIEARLDAIKDNGGNPFAEYSLPEAVIKFKQGFGRLIRSKTDTGIVVVLDKRIVAKTYGRQFLEALPAVKVQRVTI